MTEPGDPNETLAADADSGAGRTGAGETTNPTADFSSLPADSLDVGLAAAFGKAPGPPRSSLGNMRPVLLKEAEGESSLVVKPTSDAIPLKQDAGDRYRFDGEIARGGMGAVLRGRDVDLGRDLAVKVLLEKYVNRPDVARRFIEEAQIGGQLQHPGVVPVYDIGRFGDRPFFTMKLVKGQTLAAILSEREQPTDDRPRLLGIALQVSQAMAYAHAKGVIHRDLKPANIMVGAFGEVQVMDWGLAKVLAEGGVHDEERASRAHQEPQETVIRTARSMGSHGGFGTDTEAGSILGTPAYMPPEQASGDIALLDRRADVFGLGAILCEILTGKAPYLGRSSEEVRRKAANGDLADATARLDGCGGDAELIALTKKCLSPEAIDRPRDARAVADGLSDYLAGVQERLREAERERAVAEAKAIEERRRRRVQFALAASLLAFTTLGGLSTTYYLQQRAEGVRLRVEQAAAVDRVVGQAVTLRDQATGNPEDVARWQVALAAVKQAEAAQDELAAPRLLALREEVQTGLDAAQRDKTLLDCLVDIRSAEADGRDGSDTDVAYADAFRAAGIDVAELPPAEVVARIKARPPSVAMALAGALDDWAATRRDKRKNAAGAASLSQAAQTADPDPWRTELRTALDEPDKATRLTRLQALATEAKYDALGPISLYLLGSGLIYSRDRALAESVLRKAQERHPRDVWINYVLGQVLEKLSRGDEAIRFYTAARAIRPETAHELAHALEKRGDRDEAIAVLRDLRGLRPGNARHLGCLGEALKATGRTHEAEEAFEAAIVAGREEVRLKPSSAFAHGSLGRALMDNGQVDAAVASLRKAVELDPKLAATHANLGVALGKKGQIDEAIPELRKAIELNLKSANAHSNLGAALREKGQLDEAIACCTKAVELDPEHAAAHSNLGSALCEKGQIDEAIACYKKAIELNPKFAMAHANLGTALKGRGQLDEAIACFKKAIELDPKFAGAHHNLGHALRDNGQLDEAVVCFKKAVELDPKFTEVRRDLSSLERMAAARDKLPHFENGSYTPTSNEERLGLAEWCQIKKLNRTAAGLYAAAFAADPKLADDLKAWHRYNAACDAALAAAGQGDPAAPGKLENNERTRLRKQALDWLRADLALCTKQLETGKPADRAEVQRTVRHWQQDTDLAGIRDAAALAKLSGEEQKACTQLWTDVAALLKKANAPPSLASLLQQLLKARKALPKDSPQLAGLLAQIGSRLLEQKKWTEAEPLLRECLAIREKTQPDVWSTFNTKSLTGGALLGQKKYADAEPLLLAGYEGMKQREKTIPEQGKIRLPEAVERLVQLYEATGKTDEAARWQAERAKYPDDAPPEKK
jgi:eukaryotic-like serine/threonine-protein kinase